MKPYVERIVLVVLAVAVCVQAARVRIQNNRLSTTLAELTRERQADQMIAVGRKVAAIRGIDRAGTFATLPDEPHIVVTMSTTCAARNQTISQWIRFSELARNAGVPLVWVSSDTPIETASFLNRHGIVDQFLADVPHEVHESLSLSAVPQAVAVTGRTVVAASGGLTNVAQVLAAVQHSSRQGQS